MSLEAWAPKALVVGRAPTSKDLSVSNNHPKGAHVAINREREENRHRVLIGMPISLLLLPVVLHIGELSLMCVMLGALCRHIISSDFWGWSYSYLRSYSL